MICGLIAGFAVWVFVHHLGPVGVLLAAVAGLAAWWVETQLWSNGPCFWCRGKPRTSYSWCTPTAFRLCWLCKGSGRRRRLLARSS